MKVEIFVMPAWIAGIQVRRMRPETSMSAWISSTPCWNDTIEEFTKTDRGVLHLSYFSKEHLGWELRFLGFASE
jgi:hypothetical protein